jgi:peptidoglycan/LPS O-acetylase OafA/YrhL
MTPAQLRSLSIVGGAAVLFILGFSRTTVCQGLERLGLDMTVLGLGTCMLIAVAAATRWRRPPWLAPLCWLGARSYEIYLTHMFVVLAVFALFVQLGKPLVLVPALFLLILALAGLLGAAVARWYAEPVNRLLRRRFVGISMDLSSPLLHAQRGLGNDGERWQ